MKNLILFVVAQSKFIKKIKYFLFLKFNFRYMSPEMILKKGHTRAVDFYGMGAILYEMIFGFPPFY